MNVLCKSVYYNDEFTVHRIIWCQSRSHAPAWEHKTGCYSVRISTLLRRSVVTRYSNIVEQSSALQIVLTQSQSLWEGNDDCFLGFA